VPSSLSREDVHSWTASSAKQFFLPDDFFSAVDSADIALPMNKVFASRMVGDGAMATRFIAKNEIVAEYKGTPQPFIPGAEETLTVSEGPHAHYVLELAGKRIDWDGYVVDGKRIGIDENPGAWLNSVDNRPTSSKGSAGKASYADFANCQCQYGVFSGRIRLFIRATSDIIKGEELIQDYKSSSITDSAS
jgi:hypothetical protein